MKLEVEIEDTIYHKTRELFGADVDLSQVLGQMFGAILLVLATSPEDFAAVFTGQASPEQRQRIDDAMAHQASKVWEKVKR